MGNISSSLEAHYTQRGLLDRIFTALEVAGHDTHRLSPDILGPIEHLHTGGLGFTKEQAEKVGFTGGMKVARPGLWDRGTGPLHRFHLRLRSGRYRSDRRVHRCRG